MERRDKQTSEPKQDPKNTVVTFLDCLFTLSIKHFQTIITLFQSNTTGKTVVPPHPQQQKPSGEPRAQPHRLNQDLPTCPQEWCQRRPNKELRQSAQPAKNEPPTQCGQWRPHGYIDFHLCLAVIKHPPPLHWDNVRGSLAESQDFCHCREARRTPPCHAVSGGRIVQYEINHLNSSITIREIKFII